MGKDYQPMTPFERQKAERALGLMGKHCMIGGSGLEAIARLWREQALEREAAQAAEGEAQPGIE